jgi:hypothetical protein
MIRPVLTSFLAVTALVACGRPPSPAPDVAPGPSVAPAPAPAPEPAPSATSSVPAAASASPVASAAPAPVDAPLDGLSFIDQARVVFRVAACGPTGDVPSRFDAAVVQAHCDELGKAYADYEKNWVDVAEPFIAALRPKDLPPVVVYPFGGGDLVSALATFPDATEITTISLEPAGDIRPIDHLAPDFLKHELAVHRSHLERLLEKAHSRTDNLDKESKTELPGEILFDLAALVIHGDEPVGLRYFHVQRDGSLAWVTQADADAAKTPAQRRALFANAELRFRRAGVAGAPVQVLRHISFNLDDDHLKADPGLLAHLSSKGKVAAMTKAATHLLWNDHFSLIRGYLVDHTDWMISDSTGIPPRIAAPAGYVQDTYGTFDGPSPFGDPDGNDAADVKKLFATNPPHDLAFRYGYPDKHGHAHLIVTRRAGATTAPPASSGHP